MFWIIAAVVVIALVALAWRASGRNRTPDTRTSDADRKSAPGVAEHQVRQNKSPGPVG